MVRIGSEYTYVRSSDADNINAHMAGDTNPRQDIKNVIEKMGKKRPGEEEISEAWVEAATPPAPATAAGSSEKNRCWW